VATAQKKSGVKICRGYKKVKKSKDDLSALKGYSIKKWGGGGECLFRKKWDFPLD